MYVPNFDREEHEHLTYTSIGKLTLLFQGHPLGKIRLLDQHLETASPNLRNIVCISQFLVKQQSFVDKVREQGFIVEHQRKALGHLFHRKLEKAFRELSLAMKIRNVRYKRL